MGVHIINIDGVNRNYKLFYNDYWLGVNDFSSLNGETIHYFGIYNKYFYRETSKQINFISRLTRQVPNIFNLYKIEQVNGLELNTKL